MTSLEANSLRPIPTPRKCRSKPPPAPEGGRLSQRQQQQSHLRSGGSRRPFMWANPEEDFNLTELISSVERKIWLLEEMENRPAAENALSIMSLKENGQSAGEDQALLYSLPGYKPRAPQESPPPPALPPKRRPLRDRGGGGGKNSVSSSATASTVSHASTGSSRPSPLESMLADGMTNMLYYSRRLPGASSSAFAMDEERREEAAAVARELCDSAVLRPVDPQSSGPVKRLLFCPLCSQAFAYHFGLECHLLSAHSDELLDDANRPHHCPCCLAQFLRIDVLIRHLVQQHEDFFVSEIIADDELGAVNSDYVRCKFCGKDFFRRHQKLLMLHIEQKHVEEVRRVLTAWSLPQRRGSCGDWCATASTHDLDEDFSFLQSSPVPRPPRGLQEMPSPVSARRTLDFLAEAAADRSDPQEHHYYDIELDDSGDNPGAAEDKENVVNTKRGRGSEDESVPSQRAQPEGKAGKIMQVKKRLKRIDQCRGAEVRRSLELQDLLRDRGGSNEMKTQSLQRVPTYQRPRKEASYDSVAATPSAIKAKKSYRRLTSKRRQRSTSPRQEATTYYRKASPLPSPSSGGEEEAASRTPSPVFNLRRGASCRWSLLGGRKRFGGGSGRRKKQPQPQSATGTAPAAPKRLFMCNLCEVAFMENAFLLSHQRNKHRSYSVRPRYSCGACPAKFFKNSFLVKHAESHQFELQTRESDGGGSGNGGTETLVKRLLKSR